MSIKYSLKTKNIGLGIYDKRVSNPLFQEYLSQKRRNKNGWQPTLSQNAKRKTATKNKNGVGGYCKCKCNCECGSPFYIWAKSRISRFTKMTLVQGFEIFQHENRPNETLYIDNNDKSVYTIILRFPCFELEHIGYFDETGNTIIPCSDDEED